MATKHRGGVAQAVRPVGRKEIKLTASVERALTWNLKPNQSQLYEMRMNPYQTLRLPLFCVALRRALMYARIVRRIISIHTRSEVKSFTGIRGVG